MDRVSLASRCLNRGKCLEKCPQNLPVPDLLEAVAADMEGVMTKPLVWLGRNLMRVKQST